MFLDAANLSFPVAFLAGMLTFVAPCVLPILPAYISYIAGEGIKEKNEKKQLFKSSAFISSIFFVLGFLVVFVVLGLSATSVGIFLNQYRRLVQIVGGVLFVLLGMHLAGMFEIAAFSKYVKINANNHLTRFPKFNAFIIGLTFGFGWTPCIGPVLAVILFWASQAETFWTGFWLLLSFGLGLGIPFLFLSLFTEQIMKRLRKGYKAFHIAQVIAGVFIVVIGFLLVFDLLARVTAPLQQFGNLEIWLTDTFSSEQQ